MTIGELGYDNILTDNINTKAASGLPNVPMQGVTYIVYSIFLLLMPIILMNLLVSTSLCKFLPVETELQSLLTVSFCSRSSPFCRANSFHELHHSNENFQLSKFAMTTPEPQERRDKSVHFHLNLL